MRRRRKARGRVFLSDVVLVSSQVVHEGLNQEVCGEVEDQAEGDGDGQRRQGFLKDGQQQQSQAQTDKDGDEASERRVPVSTRRCSFSHQDAVEDEITEAELHPSYRHMKRRLISRRDARLS